MRSRNRTEMQKSPTLGQHGYRRCRTPEETVFGSSTSFRRRRGRTAWRHASRMRRKTFTSPSPEMARRRLYRNMLACHRTCNHLETAAEKTFTLPSAPEAKLGAPTRTCLDALTCTAAENELPSLLDTEIFSGFGAGPSPSGVSFSKSDPLSHNRYSRSDLLSAAMRT